MKKEQTVSTLALKGSIELGLDKNIYMGVVKLYYSSEQIIISYQDSISIWYYMNIN